MRSRQRELNHPNHNGFLFGADGGFFSILLDGNDPIGGTNTPGPSQKASLLTFEGNTYISNDVMPLIAPRARGPAGPGPRDRPIILGSSFPGSRRVLTHSLGNHSSCRSKSARGPRHPRFGGSSSKSTSRARCGHYYDRSEDASCVRDLSRAGNLQVSNYFLLQWSWDAPLTRALVRTADTMLSPSRPPGCMGPSLPLPSRRRRPCRPPPTPASPRLPS